MEKWYLNNREIETYNLVQNTNIFTYNLEEKTDIDIFTSEREHFEFNDNCISIPRYFYRYIGIYGEQDEYYNFLYDLDIKLKKYDKLYLGIYNNGFDRNIDFSFNNKLNIVWGKIMSLDDFNSDIICKLIDNEKLFLDFPNPVLKNQIKENFKGLIDYYFEINNDEIDAPVFKNILLYSIWWINIYFENLFIKFDYIEHNPKILYYGNITVEEVFFLIYLSSLGCDIFYFNPLKDENFDIIDSSNIFSRKLEFNHKTNFKPFPTTKIATRVRTVAYETSKELEQTLHSEDSYFYKPWQFINSNTVANTLKTTYDEIYIYGIEKCLLRPTFKVDNNTVYIPNLFSKVNGVHSDINKYWKQIYQLIDLKNVLFYKKIPLSKYIAKKNRKYYDFLDNNQNLDISRLLQSPIWKYDKLIDAMEEKIANTISYMCSNSDKLLFKNINIHDKILMIFDRLINIEEEFLRLLQQFDYPQEIPKIIIYNETEDSFSFEDTCLLWFLNLMGLDIVIFNPSGYNDIESTLSNNVFDIHRLQDIKFNLSFKEKGLFSFFKR